ncbi:ABC transporter C family protein [Tieghemostelium lacteum]|uniref:ABC transporter C family protein n=1 Tax=Tieghemostelium lacteum TaxID=361077 RepID=A0A152AAA0_TIELA|nr:ABC transporter C family protein [Tieghemostelium lacteum]|eukprot:KYR03153.1 ABC transporter C family protein [Tieghemostelium lacteum]
MFCGENVPFHVWNKGDFTMCFEDSVVMTIPAMFLLVFGLKRLYDLETKKPDLFTFTQLKRDFQTWKKSIQLEVIVSLLLVAWKVLFMVISISVYHSLPYILVYSIVTFLQWLIAFCLMYLELKKGESRSWEIRIFWLLAFITATIKLRTLTLGIFGQTDTVVSFLEYFSFIGGYCLILILSVTGVLFFDPGLYENLGEGAGIMKEENANIFSRFTFWWMNSVLLQGYKKSLEIQDVPRLTKIDESNLLSEKFEKAWEKQLEKPNPSLPWALAEAFGPHFYISAIFKIIQDSLIFVGPILLSKVISFVTVGQHGGGGSTYDGLLYVFLYFITPVIQSLALHQYFHRCFRVGMWLRSAVVTSVYKKSLRTSLREGTTIGEIVNLMSVDAQKFMDLCPYLHMIWSAVLQIAVALILLYLQLGPAVFAGLAVMLIMIPINLIIGRVAKSKQTQSMQLKDKRIKAVNEVLNGIKVIKLYSWEQSFMKHVKEIRDSELKVMTIIKYIQGIGLILWSMSPIFVSISTFTVFILSGNTLTAAIAFPCLSLFNVMQFPINMLPSVISGIIEASVSVQRLQKFLLKPDLNPNTVQKEIKEPGVAVKIENADLQWEHGKPCLQGINLKVNKGELIAVVGRVGSGKSSLVSALIGDLEKKSGSLAISGSIALVTQQAWIQNETLQNNVVFASQFNQEKYDKVVEACCLVPDIKILPGGNQTEIGEKGINLSGGQKQRVSLARSVYNDADIYLFDDPLSAVDAHVGKSIFKDVISNQTGLLKDKTRILVTHAVHYLPYVDRIVMMKNGKIVETGTFDELMNNNGSFAKLMSHESKEQLHQDEEQQSSAIATPTLSSSGKNLEIPLNNSNNNNNITTTTSTSTTKILKNSTDSNSSKKETSSEEKLEEVEEDLDEDSKLIDQAIVVDGEGTTKGDDEHHDDMEEILIDKHEDQYNESEEIEKSPKNKFDKLMKKPLGILRNLPSNIKLRSVSSPVLRQQQQQTDKSKIIANEARQEGKVSLAVYFSYFKAIGPYISTFIIFFFVATQVLSILANWWLSVWSDNSSTDSGSSSTPIGENRSKYYLGIYVAFSMAAIASTFFRSFGMVIGSIKGSQLFHEKMFESVIRSPMSFFDTTPIGRILNRFSKDQLTIDESINRTLGMFLNTFCQVFGSILVIALVSPFIIIALIPVGALFYFIQKYYLNSSRELTRLEGISRSPIYAHFSETLAGVATIRAYGESNRFISENERLLDDNQKCYYINISANRWLALRLEFLGACIVTSTVLYTVLSAHHIAAGTAGLVITYALAITSNMNWMVRMSCDLENSVVSVERIQEYCQLTPEAALIVPKDKKIEKSWPAQGGVQFKNLWLKYREGLDPVLRGVDCNIQPKQKVGIVGRTGAGKSSLTQALFRLVEPSQGTIVIDGQDIKDLGLHTLRSRLSIIPQDPVLFAGTVRSNLDPFKNYTDLQIWEALERAHLKKAIKDLDSGLDSNVMENGENFSVGQRQLLCMSRALLKKAKIIILDEATSSIDIENDALIQNTIRTEFTDCTVLTIAHRINTIATSDLVMVMDKGELVEFDSPDNLYADQGSIYHSLVKRSEVSGDDDEENEKH